MDNTADTFRQRHPDLLQGYLEQQHGRSRRGFGQHLPFWPDKVPPSGVLAVAHGASAEGRCPMDDRVELITEAVRAEFG